MNELSPRLKNALDAVAHAGQHLTLDEQDEVAAAILDVACSSDLPPEAVKPLIAEADAAIARGEAHLWEQIQDELRAKLDALPR